MSYTQLSLTSPSRDKIFDSICTQAETISELKKMQKPIYKELKTLTERVEDLITTSPHAFNDAHGAIDLAQSIIVNAISSKTDLTTQKEKLEFSLIEKWLGKKKLSKEGHTMPYFPGRTLACPKPFFRSPQPRALETFFIVQERTGLQTYSDSEDGYSSVDSNDKEMRKRTKIDNAIDDALFDEMAADYDSDID